MGGVPKEHPACSRPPSPRLQNGTKQHLPRQVVRRKLADRVKSSQGACTHARHRPSTRRSGPVGLSQTAPGFDPGKALQHRQAPEPGPVPVAPPDPPAPGLSLSSRVSKCDEGCGPGVPRSSPAPVSSESGARRQLVRGNETPGAPSSGLGALTAPLTFHTALSRRVSPFPSWRPRWPPLHLASDSPPGWSQPPVDRMNVPTLRAWAWP